MQNFPLRTLVLAAAAVLAGPALAQQGIMRVWPRARPCHS